MTHGQSTQKNNLFIISNQTLQLSAQISRQCPSKRKSCSLRETKKIKSLKKKRIRLILQIRMKTLLFNRGITSINSTNKTTNSTFTRIVSRQIVNSNLTTKESYTMRSNRQKLNSSQSIQCLKNLKNSLIACLE